MEIHSAGKPCNVLEAGISNRGEPAAGSIQALLERGDLHLKFPAGDYLIEKTLKLPSGTVIDADREAVFRLPAGAATTHDDYLMTNRDPGEGNRDIIIRGGIWDGNQRGNPRPEGLLDDGYTGAALHFRNVRGLRLENLCLRNAEAYYARFTHVHDFHIENIVFDSDRIRPNNDGIHLGGNCSRGVIRRLSAKTPGVPGDDLVALNADDALERTEVRGMTRGPIEDVLIEDLEAHSCHTFIRLLSVTSPIRNVTIRNVQGGCEVAALNGDGARGCRVQVFDEANPPFPDGVGLLENIRASGFRVHKATPTRSALVDMQERMRNFVVEDFIRNRDRDVAPDVPTIRLGYVNLVSGNLDDAVLESQSLLTPAKPWEETSDQFSVFRVETTVDSGE